LFTPVFLGSARCFHTSDWFASCKSESDTCPVFITDSFTGDGLKFELDQNDQIVSLLVVDGLLAKDSSVLGHKWRNLLKFLLIPLQVVLLVTKLRKIDRPFIFAHSTYYAFLASFTGVNYIATPQGSEVLVRPRNSVFYKWFLKRSVLRARAVTVDSVSMAQELEHISGVQAVIIQNGINVRELTTGDSRSKRKGVLSVRGLEANYRQSEILRARNEEADSIPIEFCYPFDEANYAEKLAVHLRPGDKLLGRLDRLALYKKLKSCMCVISIPTSDSSPRSVYEAIFCGAVVVVSNNEYLRKLPKCMLERVIVVDPEDRIWFLDAVSKAKSLMDNGFSPSKVAVDMFDQRMSMKRVLLLAESFASN